jgi:hypothetical protein
MPQSRDWGREIEVYKPGEKGAMGTVARKGKYEGRSYEELGVRG